MNFETIIMAIAALALVLGMVLLAQRAARWGGLVPRGGGRLALVEAIAIDPRRRMTLVRCDGRHVLVLTGGGQDVVVGWIEPSSGAEGAP
jgi:flagellar protein FliO/FliZ